jgi:hypothetical protein
MVGKGFKNSLVNSNKIKIKINENNLNIQDLEFNLMWGKKQLSIQNK